MSFLGCLCAFLKLKRVCQNVCADGEWLWVIHSIRGSKPLCTPTPTTLSKRKSQTKQVRALQWQEAKKQRKLMNRRQTGGTCMLLPCRIGLKKRRPAYHCRSKCEGGRPSETLVTAISLSPHVWLITASQIQSSETQHNTELWPLVKLCELPHWE